MTQLTPDQLRLALVILSDNLAGLYGRFPDDTPSMVPFHVGQALGLLQRALEALNEASDSPKRPF